jgi:hypothetical protein
MYFIEQILDVRPYRVTVRFNTGEVRVVDLASTLHAKAASPESAYRRLLDPALFCQVRLDRESRTLCWDGLARMLAADGTEQPAPLDFCPDVLYRLSVPVTQSAADAAVP